MRFLSFSFLLIASMAFATCSMAATLGFDAPVSDAPAAAVNLASDSVRPQSLPSLLIDFRQQLIERLLSIFGRAADTAEGNDAKATIYDLKTILGGAVENIKLLANQPPDVILGYEGKVLSHQEVAQLLVPVLTDVLKIVSTVGGSATGPNALVITEIGTLVGELLVVVLGLVAGFLQALLPSLTGLIQPIKSLGWVEVLQILKQ